MNTANSAKITFFYLLSLFGLVFAAISSGMILFQVINKLIPDAINYSGRFSADALRFAISAVIVATPVYYWMTSLIQKSLKKGELDKESQLRKWMTYIIIFVSAVVIIVSLIGIINNYLSGDLTSKIALKVLTTIVISGIVLSYYLYNIKRVNFEKDTVVKVYFWSSIALAVIILVSGFLVADSPAQVRKMKHDSNILRDFNNIKYGIDEHVRNNDSLPENLSEINRFARLNGDAVDYEYKIISDDEYELCAEFETSNKEELSMNDDYFDKEWPHEIGHQCFQEKAQAELDVMIRPELEGIPLKEID
jgi:TRAP-type C4-dicarboxylate transport system permease small subunit